jgi:hypothetical protein
MRYSLYWVELLLSCQSWYINIVKWIIFMIFSLVPVVCNPKNASHVPNLPHTSRNQIHLIRGTVSIKLSDTRHRSLTLNDWLMVLMNIQMYYLRITILFSISRHGAQGAWICPIGNSWRPIRKIKGPCTLTPPQFWLTPPPWESFGSVYLSYCIAKRQLPSLYIMKMCTVYWLGVL